MFSVLRMRTSVRPVLLFWYLPSGRLSHATAKNKAAAAGEEAPDTVPAAVRKAGCRPHVDRPPDGATPSQRHEHSH
jgi:hypothetical protein